MSEEARQAALEEKRRARRRANILASGNSRLDAICGIVTTPTSEEKTPQAVTNTSDSQTHKHEPVDESKPLSSPDTSSGPATPVLDSTPTGEEHSPKQRTSIRASETVNPSPSSSKSPSPVPTAAATLPPSPSLNQLFTAPLIDSAAGAPQISRGQPSKRLFLIMGTLFALLLALVQTFLPEYSRRALIVLGALEILLWTRYEEQPEVGGIASMHRTVTAVFSQQEGMPDIVTVIQKAWRLSKSIMNAAEDYLLAQFIAVLLICFTNTGPVITPIV